MSEYKRLILLFQAKLIKLGFTEIEAITYALDIVEEERELAKHEAEMRTVLYEEVI